MIATRLISMITAAVTGIGPAVANAEDIALSLVHPQGRIDSPVGALKRVEAGATFAVRNTDTGEVHQRPDPHVEVCYTKDIQERVCELTQKIVGQPMEVVIDCAPVVKPIVRQPLCATPCLMITANDFAEASALAQRIRQGSNRACAPSS
jgi:preprotein translocase subunit SecD